LKTFWIFIGYLTEWITEQPNSQKELGVVDTSKECRTCVASFQAVYDLRSFVTWSLV